MPERQTLARWSSLNSINYLSHYFVFLLSSSTSFFEATPVPHHTSTLQPNMVLAQRRYEALTVLDSDKLQLLNGIPNTILATLAAQDAIGQVTGG
ncbi:hypothetical protein HO133_009443 [Letharia lupina]|uniref:Uncharacterized protein n=1 Tax=Letharia lupina TaxID=560253 RepID=A0A8H6CN53_9LECA|nr:uncharacterized protein HO133_009443 [Letharia lupina]KAF6226577.1 hypothetical protein HO133_009443 [Letharia lupina]